ALAITIANPTDLVKVRLQSEGQLPSGVPKRYSGAMDAYSTIIRQTILKIPGFIDNAFTHLLAGLGAGLFAVFIGSPVDV
ncbi:mitochondrial-like uncoupling protein 1-like, partial [Trifolium medium]|nr:mitochondrial-like uncoupling protein 1-like [Trifolium medium]